MTFHLSGGPGFFLSHRPLLMRCLALFLLLGLQPLASATTAPHSVQTLGTRRTKGRYLRHHLHCTGVGQVNNVNRTIVIDPGHGGAQVAGNSRANNATGPKGTKEKDLALDIALRTADTLNGKGYSVLLTRNSDLNLDLKDRAAVALKNKATVFLSIHFNGDADPTIQGSETWVHAASTADSRLLASSVQQRVVGVTGYGNRGVRSKGLGVLSLAYHSPDTAACMVEISFLTDSKDEARLQDASYKDKIATALAQAIVDYIERSSSITPLKPVPTGDPNGDGDN
jgi:N-acetylmuramoyl-L-alanine amidase